jgi:hypothetical protein
MHRIRGIYLMTRAHLIGLCSGALIILGTTAAVCTVMHWL